MCLGILVFVFFSFSLCRADVYGLLLKINAYDGSNELANGSVVDAKKVQGGKIRFLLKVIDPNDSNLEFEVDYWNVKLTQDGDNIFSFTKSAHKNILDVDLTSKSWPETEQKTINLWGQATVGSKLTNEVNFKLVFALASAEPSVTASSTSTPLANIAGLIRPPEAGVKVDWKVLGTAFLSITALISFALPAIIAFGALPFIFSRRKTKWGVVFDSKTQKPISRAAVSIYSMPERKLRGRQLTNREGAYGFSVPSGEYMLTVLKAKYGFPSKEHNLAQTSYKNPYYGGRLFVNPGRIKLKSFEINIPLDALLPGEASNPAGAIFPKTAGSFIAFRYLVLVLGLLLSLYSIYSTSDYKYYLFFIYFLALFILGLRGLMKKRTYVLSSQNDEPIEATGK